MVSFFARSKNKEGLTNEENVEGVQPTAPQITNRLIATQFWRDIYGKEVQSAATYSYLWIADQMGHIGLGLLLQTLLFLIIDALGCSFLSPSLGSFLTASLGFAFWETCAYRSSSKAASNEHFRLDAKLLRDNAVTATLYMVFGALYGFAVLHDSNWRWLIFLLITVFSLLLAKPWLRQKITWQKAALPYLLRLADFKSKVDAGGARAVVELIDNKDTVFPRRHFVVCGPVGSGRTPFICGLATELAFKNRKVRYIQFDMLAEINSRSPSDPSAAPYLGSWGPNNIFYWPWYQSELLLIDNVGPFVGLTPESNKGEALANTLRTAIGNLLPHLKSRATVWVMNVDPTAVDTNASDTKVAAVQVLKELLGASEDPCVIALSPP